MDRKEALRIIADSLEIVDELAESLMGMTDAVEALDDEDLAASYQVARAVVRNRLMRAFDETFESDEALEALARFYSEGLAETRDAAFEKLMHPATGMHALGDLLEHEACPPALLEAFTLASQQGGGDPSCPICGDGCDDDEVFGF